MTELELQGWLALPFSMLTAVGIVFNIRQIIVSTGIAKASAGRAEAVALLAAEHAQQTVIAVHDVADNVQKIEVATNSMKDALVTATATASDLVGEKRGIAIGRAQERQE